MASLVGRKTAWVAYLFTFHLLDLYHETGVVLQNQELLFLWKGSVLGVCR